MLHTMTYQLYTAADQRPADLPSGEIAAGLRDLRLSLGRALRRRRHTRPVRTAGTITMVRALPSGR
jgi:hypothetical protein